MMAPSSQTRDARGDRDRHSLRWRGHDYELAGAYFVTVCAWQRECLLADIEDARVQLSPAGEIVQNSWRRLPERFPSLALDAFVIMPNHVHGVLFVDAPVISAAGSGTIAVTLGQVMRAFKSLSAVGVNKLTGREGLPLWQRGYHDRVIRNQGELERIERYILDNPARWGADPDNLISRSVNGRAE